jgi:hypothetical protein
MMRSTCVLRLTGDDERRWLERNEPVDDTTNGAKLVLCEA